MAFYHRTLYDASGITHSVIGNFLDEKKEDIIVSTGRILKLLRFELGDTSGAIHPLISVDTYSIISSLSKFRKKDETKDWIAIAGDSGNTTILTVNAEKKEFEVVFLNTFKVQFSKTLPVQHLAVDFQGDAIFAAAIEEVKRLWIFHGPGNRLMKILDDCEKKTLIYDVAFVDINSKDIVVAYLATAYKELHPGVKYEKRDRQKRSLVFCKVDEDKVTEIKRITCFDYANSLISVPGERGVLVCAEDFIAFYSLDSLVIRCSIPKRIMDPKVGVIFVCSTKCSGKNPNLKDGSSKADVSFASSVQNSIYYLAQTEQGDIFRIQLVVSEQGVNEIVLQYFITLPVASALSTFESGFLFVASEFGDHRIYKMADIENRARVHPSFSSALALPIREKYPSFSSAQALPIREQDPSFSSAQDLPKREPFLFMHRTLNIVSVAEMKSMSPIMHMEFEPLSSMRPRMCLAMGRGSLSSLKISEVERDVSYQIHAKIEKEDDEIPSRMWAIKSTVSISKESETLIVVSFEDTTAVYSLERASEFVIQKRKGTPFATQTNTLGCAKTGEDAIVQVCPEGLCLITGGRNMVIYQTEEDDAIGECAINKKCLVIVSENKKELRHYEIDENGYVTKSKIASRLIEGPATCMLLSNKSESDQLLAVGTSIPPAKASSSSKVPASVNEVHLLNIGLKEIKLLYKLKVKNSPFSFLFINGESNLQSLLVGCENGTLLTLPVEETAETEGTTKHELKEIKTYKIGSEAVQLLHAPVLGKVHIGYGILAVSNHSWFKESIVGDFLQLKSDISPCICAVPGSERIATILDDHLRVFILEDLQPKPPVTFRLEYTPKKFTVDSYTGNIFIIETDNNSYTEETKEKKRKEFEEHRKAKSQQSAVKLPPLENIPKSWASLLRVVNLTGANAREVFKLPFEQSEAALSLCRFQQGDDDLLLVGVAKNFNLSTKCCRGAWIYTYKILEQGETISFKQTDKIDIKSAPLAMCCYEGIGRKYVLIGIGRKLALYCVEPELKLKLVCEKKECVSSSITAIYPVDKRILVSDSDFGISYLVYVPSDNSLYLLQEDVFPSEVTAACILSGNRMARATKFRNIFIVELGTLQDRDMSKVYNDNEPPFTLSKEKSLGCFHVGEIVTSMQIFNTLSSVPDTVVYTTLSGSVGTLLWLPWEKDAEYLNFLYETVLRLAEDIDKKRNALPLLPNSRFRSRHYQRENVIDGDFLEEFFKSEVGIEAYSSEMEEEDVTQISTKLENLRRSSMLYFQF